MDFPIFNSKSLSDGNIYDLGDAVSRKRYFEAKLGSKIDAVKEYLDTGGGFIGYLLAKKQAGKGTYSKMIEEILGPERYAHISAGDLVRKYHKLLENPETDPTLYSKLKKEYRGFISLDDAIKALLSRTQDKVSVPSELMLALLKIEIDSLNKPALFIDGLPRTIDQVSYSLFFRQLVNYKDSPDFFVLIDVPEEIIDARMKGRFVCPLCATSKNMYFNPSRFIRFFENHKPPYYFLCDNSLCTGFGKQELVSKEGDAAGKSSIAERLKQDQELMEMAFSLHGIPKILLRSTVDYDKRTEYLEDYEVQKSYFYHVTNGEVITQLQPWVFNDDDGKKVVTMYAATYVVNLFSQIYDILV